MALEIGDLSATSGMTQTIYEQIRAVMEPDLGELDEADLEDMREGWRKLAFAVATGVVEHIRANMEIVGVQTRGNVSATVNGNTGVAPPADHRHAVNLTATQTSVTFTQSNDGTGHVQ